MKIIVKVVIGIVGFLLILVGLAFIGNMLPNLQQNTNTIPNTTTLPQSIPSSTSTPSTVNPYVEVDYTQVGWFYDASSGYNYTYLVLNVNITNHGYDQVNINDFSSQQFGGFSVKAGNTIYYTSYGGHMTNDSFQWSLGYSYSTTMPYKITLLNTGTYGATIVFQFGDPTIIPNPAQIINVPFPAVFRNIWQSRCVVSDKC